MRVLWTFNEFGKRISQLDLIMLLASTKLWSFFCPGDNRILYCNRELRDLLVSLGMSKVFDEIITLSRLPNFSIDSQVFWSWPKLQVLLTQTEPVRMVDHDFMVFSDIRQNIDSSRLCYNYTEDAVGYYPSSFDPVIKGLSYSVRWPDESANVSFLHLPDPEWTSMYAGVSLQIMEELSGKASNSLYLIFAEQMVLKHLVPENYQCLLKNVYRCRTESWSDYLDPHGIWDEKEALWKKFIHYGPVKRRWNLGTYNKEMSWLMEISGLDNSLLDRTNYLRR